MRLIFLLLLSFLSYTTAFAQKKIQELQPARIGIFKNGTCFIKREAKVTVADKSFFIQAPDKVLMGTYWLAVGKESPLHSIVVKTDTFKTEHTARYMADFLLTNLNQNITLMGNAANTEIRKLTGKLLDFDPATMMMRVAAPTGNIIIASSLDFSWMEINNKMKTTLSVDSITPVAKVKLTKDIPSTWISTISLERGTQWFPSYLFTVLNEKEAKLELKATIANGKNEFRNLPVDIIIGSPEIFYGRQLDPVCIDYLSESLSTDRYDNNGLFNNSFASYNLAAAVQTTSGAVSNGMDYNWGDEGEANQKKEGQKMEDLYYYQLGVIDLEKNSRIIVPVMSTTVTYAEIYTTNLPLNSSSLEGDESIQTFHSYFITNNSSAPLTTGPALVMGSKEQPLAQAELTYTPVKGSSEMQLSKAVDVQVKNDEEEAGREKSSVKKNTAAYYEKINTAGRIIITNYKDKKIKIRVTKSIDGTFVTADNNGKSRKAKAANNIAGGTEIFWEVEVEGSAKMELKYEYYILK